MIVNVCFWFPVALYKFRDGISLRTVATANFTGGELATTLRKVRIFAGIFDSYSFGKAFGCCRSKKAIIF